MELRQLCFSSNRIAEISVPGVADTDPPHEIDDGEAPAYRDVDAPDADAEQEQVGDRDHQQHHQTMRDE